MKNDIRLNDLARLAFGDNSPLFIVEALIRVVVLYGLIVISLRLMGSRMSTLLTRNELLALVALAAAIGPALQDPTKGLAPPILIALIVVLFQRSVALGTFRSRRLDRLVQGESTMLIRNGVIDVSSLKQSDIPRERLMGVLRSKGITNLGEVERVYLEPNGAFTVLTLSQPRPGLSVVPAWDPELLQEQAKARDVLACTHCGKTHLAHDKPVNCSNCGRCQWACAVRA